MGEDKAQRVEEVAHTRVAHETNEGIKADEGAAHQQGDHNKKLKKMLKKNAIRAKKIEKRRKLKVIRTHALQEKTRSAGDFTKATPAGKGSPEPWDELPSL